MHGLVDKKIMMDENDPYFLAYIKEEGIDISQLVVEARDYSYKRLFDREVDASAAYITDLPYIMKNSRF